MSEVADIRRLPKPVSEIWDWQLQSLCRTMDTAVFFHPERERGDARTSRENRAKAVCQRCPVLAQCRAHALSVREPYGIWGGLTAHEREVELARRAKNTKKTKQTTAA
ncbi:MAG TPA: WhiB family transcriptional regulator [Pseudonocardiaceae bacterium]|nr:WhiB family transcriptional regulator [Pseudonocardiaceae bacterium]